MLSRRSNLAASWPTLVKRSSAASTRSPNATTCTSKACNRLRSYSTANISGNKSANRTIITVCIVKWSNKIINLPKQLVRSQHIKSLVHDIHSLFNRSHSLNCIFSRVYIIQYESLSCNIDGETLRLTYSNRPVDKFKRNCKMFQNNIIMCSSTLWLHSTQATRFKR